MPDFIHTGAKAPESYVLNIVPGDSGVDLSTVTAAEFSVQTPDGTETTWDAATSNETASTLTLTHEFDALGAETAEKGTYTVYALLTIPSGVVRTLPQKLRVKGEYEV